jgi:CheY-like chemotaxis protein
MFATNADGNTNAGNNTNGTPKVLVVDDESVIADTLAAVLRNSGYTVRTAYNASAAIAVAQEFVPDLVITDVVMPGMNGIEMAIRIREMLPLCKVLLFSGQAATANLLAEAKQRGHDFELLAKPIHPTDLLAKLRS